MKKLKGISFIIIGAASYGILATFVKVAGQEGFSTASVTLSQYIAGFLVLALLDLKKKPVATGSGSDKYKLLLGGTCLGLTSTFYYLAVQYLPVSVCIILLMQTIWMGILVDCMREKKRPEPGQLLAIVVVLGGTFLATGFTGGGSWSFVGVCWGLLAAMSYTGSMYAANHIATDRPLFYRSKLLVLGGMLAILVFWNVRIAEGFRPEVLWRYGLILSLFGTILPPIFFNKGFPLVGMSLGSVLAAIEIPVSIGTAHIVLREQVSSLQIVGCGLVIMGMIIPNIRLKKVWLAAVLLFAVVPVKAAAIDTLKVYSAAMHKEITTLVVRPAKQQVPSVYVLHGYSGHPFRTLQLDIPSLPAMADLYNMAFILPDGQYDKWYLNSSLVPDVQYETFLGKELPEYIDQHYAFVKNRFGRAIMGWSMGGYGALHVGMMYAGTFGAIGSMCGAVSIVPEVYNFGMSKLIGTDTAVWKRYDVLSNARQLAFSQQELIMTCGISDPFLVYNRALDAKLNELKIHHTYIEQEGGHNFQYWSAAAEYEVLFFHRYFEGYRK
ncbi:EamA family transporter [Chitinophaga sancti]|uniref:Alpha/beta hydrolase-fold protein n=1 Tax=Chitinophaga sancti TaxID=1004 RepID=A0A1K1T089_9BACT|nr:EamA family transporter [Chitinophaga sancti]WQD63105.1 alpha/beta hydrolase-fold protein [Chitinophaga sancti]WQG91270.1 alpha/beta hydrolase-fold protein [Chitinophaga sancti]SFW90041.1 S-formylglutathione hydrolase FrmB [Chitinophaga sancti]